MDLVLFRSPAGSCPFNTGGGVKAIGRLAEAGQSWFQSGCGQQAAAKLDLGLLSRKVRRPGAQTGAPGALRAHEEMHVGESERFWGKVPAEWVERERG